MRGAVGYGFRLDDAGGNGVVGGGARGNRVVGSRVVFRGAGEEGGVIGVRGHGADVCFRDGDTMMVMLVGICVCDMDAAAVMAVVVVVESSADGSGSGKLMTQ